MLHSKYRAWILVIAFGVLSPVIRCQEAFKPMRTEEPPVIDGILNDPAWQRVAPISGFLTYAPDYGKPMLGDTKIFMTYDEDNLYFAFRCFDPEPEKIRANISARDNMQTDDWVCINMDSYFDHLSGYGLYINPLGIQGDTRFTATGEDAGFDLVWYSAGRIDSEGYTLEVSIPLQSIRFSEKDTVTMGVIFERKISRRQESGTYPALDPARGQSNASWLVQMHPILYPGLKQKRLLEVLPALTYSRKYESDQGDLHLTENKSELGLTAKYGITPELILDGTYKPDFSQVESDAGQVDVNLRHALFYPEKRPFFQEGAENFSLAATSASELDPIQSIVNTRTIVSPLAGAKLAGKLGDENTLAVLYAADRLTGDESIAGGKYNHFVAVRYKRAYGEDNYLGGLYTAFEQTGHHNRLAVLDGQIRTTHSAMLGYNGMLSKTKADPSSSEATGHSVGLRYGSVSRELDYVFSFKDVAENFNAEMGVGYITRTGVTQGTALVSPKFYPSGFFSFFPRVSVELFTGQTRDRFFDMWETSNHVTVTAFLSGSATLAAKYSYSTEIFEGERFKTGGFQLTCSGQWTKELYAGVQYARVKAILYTADPLQGSSHVVTASARYQPVETFNTEFAFSFSDFTRDSDGGIEYDYPISRLRLTYQLNRYVFFRGVVQDNNYRGRLLTDFLASFTYIPGTVIHIGYGSLYEKLAWENGAYTGSSRFLETKRGFFFKTSYLWRV